MPEDGTAPSTPQPTAFICQNCKVSMQVPNPALLHGWRCRECLWRQRIDGTPVPDLRYFLAPEAPINLASPPLWTWRHETPNSLTLGGRTRALGGIVLLAVFSAITLAITLNPTAIAPVINGLPTVLRAAIAVIAIIAAIYSACMLAFGKQEVSIVGENATATSGFGPIVNRRTFRVDQVTDIYRHRKNRGAAHIRISLGGRSIGVFGMLNTMQQRYLLVALNDAITHHKARATN